MFLEKLTDANIEKFITEYTKSYHVENKHCYDDCVVDVIKIKRDKSLIRITTQIRDNAGKLIENWELTSFKGFYCTESKSLEVKSLTKKWTNHIYTTLQSTDKTIAEKFKFEFNDYLKRERDARIAVANENYSGLTL